MQNVAKRSSGLVKSGIGDTPSPALRNSSGVGLSCNFGRLPGGLFPAQEMQVREFSGAIAIIGQGAVDPVPVFGKVAASVDPGEAGVRSAECLDVFGSAGPGIERFGEVGQPIRPVFVAHEQSAEGTFVESDVVLVFQQLFPVGHCHESASHFQGVPDQAKVPGNPAPVGGKNVFPRKSFGGKIVTQVAVYEIEIAKRPKVVFLQFFLVNQAKRRLEVAKLVRVRRGEVDAKGR